MKRTRTALTTLFAMMLVFTTIVLAGCSGSTGSSGTPFSQTLNPEEGVRIWYECQNRVEEKEEETDLNNLFSSEVDTPAEPVVYGRETRIVWIKVYKDGKLTTYSCAENVYLGYFAKMTDEEILKELAGNPDKYFVGQKDEPYEVYLYTDATGQEVMFEGVPSKIRMGKDADPMYFMTLISKDQIASFQVYDSFYGGYALYNYDETLFGEAIIVTRCEQKETFSLDGMDLEDAVLDYMTPEEMLHEKNAELKLKNKKADDTETTDGSENSADTDSGENTNGATEGEAETEKEGVVTTGN